MKAGGVIFFGRRKPIRTEQRSGAVYFIVYSVLTFESVDEFPKYDNSNENYKCYFPVVRFILPIYITCETVYLILKF